MTPPSFLHNTEKPDLVKIMARPKKDDQIKKGIIISFGYIPKAMHFSGWPRVEEALITARGAGACE